MGRKNRFSHFVGFLAEIYTNIDFHFKFSKSFWIKVLMIISWPLRVIINLPAQLVILANYFYGYYLFRIRNKLEIIGRENLPKGSGNLFLPNHQAWTDPWGVGYSLSNIIKIVFYPSWVPWTIADEKNYFNQWFGAIMWLTKVISVRRGVGGADVDAKERWKKYLGIGNLVLYFEGTRSRTKEIQTCKKDVARFIYENFRNGHGKKYFKQAIPVKLVGFDEIQPAEVDKTKIKKALLNPFRVGKGKKCQIIIGKPIEFDEKFFQEDFVLTHKQIEETIRQAVIDL